jgi:hypothetical protein
LKVEFIPWLDEPPSQTVVKCIERTKICSIDEFLDLLGVKPRAIRNMERGSSIVRRAQPSKLFIGSLKISTDEFAAATHSSARITLRLRPAPNFPAFLEVLGAIRGVREFLQHKQSCKALYAVDGAFKNSRVNIFSDEVGHIYFEAA